MILLESNLQMVARDGLVKRECFDFKQRPTLQVERVDGLDLPTLGLRSASPLSRYSCPVNRASPADASLQDGDRIHVLDQNLQIRGSRFYPAPRSGRPRALPWQEILAKGVGANVRWAAARLTAARGQPLVDELAALLVDPDEDVRHEAHEALMRISRGEDYGPLDDTNLQERQEAKERWREWWVFAQRERKESINRHRVTDTPEEIAEIALKMAGNLERTGRQEEADRRYRNIASRFPDTDAPRVARERFAP